MIENKEALFEFLKNYETDYGYDAEEAMSAAEEEGLIGTHELIQIDIRHKKRWGDIVQFAFDIFEGNFLAIDVYVMDEATNGEDLFEHVYEVVPYEVTITKYKEVSSVEIEVFDE